MPLSKQQISNLIDFVATAESDTLDCDRWCGRVAEFAEAQMQGAEISQSLQAVEVHRRQCLCCEAEYESLIDGLEGLKPTEDTWWH